MNKRILAIGRNSMLARWWQATDYGRSKVSFVSHAELDNLQLEHIETVVSFCRHPDYDCRLLEPQEDPNGKIATWLAGHDTRLVILSSCKVYGRHDRALKETDPANSNAIGGRNRRQSEQIAQGMLGDRLTVLRCSNIFGFELDKNRPRFMTMLLHGLRNTGRIEFDCKPDTRRDFLADLCFLRCLERVAEQPSAGILNLGSGIPLKMRDIAGWVIEGYGTGRIVQTADTALPDVTVDVTRFTRTYNAPAKLSDIRDRCRAIGRMLRN